MKRLLCASFAALSLVAAPPNPVTWKIDDSPDKPVKTGARFTVKLTAHIEEGWHFYSLKPIEDGPIPTRIWLAEGQPFQLTGAIGADAPETLLEATLHEDVELYEGSATFSLPVRVTAGSETGSRKLVVNAQTQSCNNSMCLPPTTMKVEVPVTIGK